jgi:hypothetical protein
MRASTSLQSGEEDVDGRDNADVCLVLPLHSPGFTPFNPGYSVAMMVAQEGDSAFKARRP